MKQFIHNILSHVKREQVKEKITKTLNYDSESKAFTQQTAPTLWTGSDFTLNVATITEKLISTIYPNDKNIEIKASYEGDEQRYQPISNTRYRNTWFRKLNALYLQKDGHQYELWSRTKGLVGYPQKMPYLASSDYDPGFLTQLLPEQEEVPQEYEHLIPYFDIIQITRIEIVEKELLLESVRPFRFIKDLRVPILTETDRFIKIYYKYTDIKRAQERYEEKQHQLELETAFTDLIEGN